MKKKNVQEKIHLTKGTRQLIKNIIKETESTNRYVLCAGIAKSICDTHVTEDSIQYQSGRMRLDTTKKILDAIDSYFYHYHRD